MKNLKKLLFIVLTVVLVWGCTFSAYGAEMKSFTENGKILSVAHWGNWTEYPLGSYEAISSAYDLGADCVSVSLEMTKDFVFVVSKYDDLSHLHSSYNLKISDSQYVDIQNLGLPNNSGSITSTTICSLSDALEVTKRYDKILIIDNAWEHRNELYTELVNNNALEYAMIRTDASKKEIEEFLSLTDNKVNIIGAYHGNIIFNAKSYVSTLNSLGCKAVMLSTTNPFGVIFNQSMLSSYSVNNYSTRAMIATYDPDLCGQRTDTSSTWNDLIDRGYSIIETNHIRDLTEYLEEIEKTKTELQTYMDTIDAMDLSLCSQKSASDLQEARATAYKELTTLSSLETLSKAKHNITLAFETLSLDDGNYEKRGVLKITTGKIIAVTLVGAGILWAQIFFYKKSGKKMKKQ